MLSKIISIKNVGRFRQSAGPVVPQLRQNVLVLGANGFGKTTLCAILRSLQTGEIDYIAGRQTLGSIGSCEINLMTSAGNVRFGGTGWSAIMPQILIFDGTFVAENVHAGDVVELEQKRNLYRVIIGQDGIGLAAEDARLAAESREKTAVITAAGKGLQTHLPPGMKLGDFLKLPADEGIDHKIVEQTKTVEALRQAEQLKNRAAMTEFTLPMLPDSLAATLARTIDDVAEDAERQVAAHLAAHQMTDHGEAWLAEGTPFIAGERCPFCGQSLEGLPLVAAYRSLFSETYNRLKADIAELRAAVEQDFGDKATGALATHAATNAAALEFWRHYCTIAPGSLEQPEGLAPAIAGLKDAVLDLLDRKEQAPLEGVDLPTDSGFLEHRAAFDLVHAALFTVNTSIRAANAAVAAKKAATAGGDVTAADTALKRLAAIKKRHEKAVADACTAYGELEADKANIETQKTAARTQLESHSKKVVKPYERRINELLDDFNAGFSIAETKYAYPGGLPTSSYQLVINQTAIDVGDGKTALSKPSFKNTLSAGDRTTLALASLSPIWSATRTAQNASSHLTTLSTVRIPSAGIRPFIISKRPARRARRCSSCPTMPRFCARCDKCADDQRIAIQITDHLALGSKIGPCNLEDCKGRVASEIDDLMSFVSTGAGKTHDIAKKMRVVLETYCRAAYPNSFDGDDMLGTIVGKVRAASDQHPAYPLLDALDQINDYTRDAHHGADPTDGAADQLDASEMRGYVRRTLKISNNLQA